MTAIVPVTKKEMHEKTGFKTALGYALPKEDKILVRKGLSKKKKKEVLEHEEEHMIKGEEGPFIVPLIAAGASLLGASKQASASKSAARTAAKGAERELEFARESRDLVRADQAPYRQAGYKALEALMSLTGLGGGAASVASRPAAPMYPMGQAMMWGEPPIPQSQLPNGRMSQYQIHPRFMGGAMNAAQVHNVGEMMPEDVYSGGGMTRVGQPTTMTGQQGYVNAGKPLPPAGVTMGGANTTAIDPATGYPRENPGGVEGGYQFQTDPGYQFRFQEGMRALDRGAAARGGLLSGGYGRKAIRYGQGFASNEYTNVYNRIANIAGIGQTANAASGQATMYGGQMMGNAASNAANASAYGTIGAGNAWATAGNQISQIDWGSAWDKWKSRGTGYDGRTKTDPDLMGPPIERQG